MGKKKTGRRGKYQEWLTEDGLLQLQAWARDGLIDEQIAKNIGIATGTLYAWKNRFPEIDDALKRGKAVVDIEVENALLKRALGYDYEESTAYQTMSADGSIEQRIVKHKKHQPPETAAAIFWLKNRKCESWRNADRVGLNDEKTRAEIEKIKADTEKVRASLSVADDLESSLEAFRQAMEGLGTDGNAQEGR